MSICLKCKKQLEDNVKYCSECGTKVSHMATCPHCKKKINAEFIFCPYCGVAVENDVVEETYKKPLFHIDKKLTKKGGSFVAAILVVVIAVSLIVNGVGKENYLFYLKDEELFLANLQNLKRWQITDDLNDSVEFDDQQMKNYASNFSDYVKISKDKNTIFYMEQLESISEFSLYYRKVNGNKEPKKLAKNVTKFQISNTGDSVSYLRKDGSLYWDDLNDREKLANGVTTFYMSEDGRKLLYLTKEGDAYFHIVGKEKQKIDSQITRFNHVSKDLNTVYYSKISELYKKVSGKEAVLISSDVKDIVQIYESGEIYYLKGDFHAISLADYVEDDMQEVDATMIYPETPPFPSLSDYATQEEYEAACEQYAKVHEEYQQNMTKYTQKVERDKLRNIGLEGKTIEILQYQLFYFDGKKEHIVAEKVEGYKNYAKENTAVIYSVYNDTEVKKVKFSDIENSYNIENMVSESLASNCKNYIASKAKSSEINQPGAFIFNLNAEADMIYILAEQAEAREEGETVAETNNTNSYDLYQMKVSGAKVRKAKKIDSNVYRNISLIDNDRCVYYKKVDATGQNGDLYIAGKKVESDVRINTIKYDEDTDNLWYIVDWEKTEQYGTLKKYNGDKIVKISDEVYCYEILTTGDVLYLYDYHIENYEGELYLYKKNKSKKVDDDVVTIIPMKE